jgi:crotonobetainyl-CoA:carnitine CoA-transferase CaiB-like acyl-CoA transferase
MAVRPETSPLHGYTVGELSTGIAGAYCTKLFADGGAQVIKVEPPVGDPLRTWSAVPVRFSAGPDRFHLRPAPLLGEHNHELLAEIGLSAAEIAELEADGVIGLEPGGAKTAARQ